MNASFKVNLSGSTPQVELNGTGLNGVREVQLFQRHGEFPRIVCVFDADQIEVEGEGTVDLMSQTHALDATTFLAGVNAANLDTAVMARTTFGTSPIVDALEVLKEMASGSPS